MVTCWVLVRARVRSTGVKETGRRLPRLPPPPPLQERQGHFQHCTCQPKWCIHKKHWIWSQKDPKGSKWIQWDLRGLRGSKEIQKNPKGPRGFRGIQREPSLYQGHQNLIQIRFRQSYFCNAYNQKFDSKQGEYKEESQIDSLFVLVVYNPNLCHFHLLVLTVLAKWSTSLPNASGSWILSTPFLIPYFQDFQLVWWVKETSNET